MKKSESLLQAVIAAPDDDAPRFAFADWLQKNGDADRADFIRVQCALDKMSPQAPERASLVVREKELLDQHAWRWAEEFGERLEQWVYRRGFIERVQMNLEVPAEQILAIFNKAPIRHIRDISQFCDLKGVIKVLPHFERLTGLEFWYFYAVKSSQVAKLLASRHLRNLRTLIMHHDRNGNLIPEAVLIKGLTSPYRANLEELAVNVDGCWRGPSLEILKAIARSPYLRNLRKLNLTNAGDEGHRPRMNLETARALGKSRNLAGLEELDLGATSFPLQVWKEVLKWPCLARLKWLRLYYARQVRASSPYTIAELKNLPKISAAFEKQVSHVDWETEFVSPWDGDTCWKGFAWRDRTHGFLFAMYRFVQDRDYAGLEAEYRQLCRQVAGDKKTKEIDELPFKRYESQLVKAFGQAPKAQAKKRGRVAFLRIDIDHEWQGELHIDESGQPQQDDAHREDMHPTPATKYAAPSFPAAAKIYSRQHLYGGTQVNAQALYLLARTVAAFGRSLTKSKPRIPIYFSCVHVAFRMPT